MRITREELDRMAIKTDYPKVTRITTVSNVSTTPQFSVERADNAKNPPPTRPAGQPERPRPTVIPRNNPQVRVVLQRARERAAQDSRGDDIRHVISSAI